jgi:hypothetical protein
MPPVLNFYLDESGSRTPDRVAAAHVVGKPNAFAFGGVLVRAEDEAAIREAHAAICAKWSIAYPLHSVDIRNASKEFSWLRRDSGQFAPFMADLTETMCGIPAIGLACVVDRPGYDARYREEYGRRQWLLCRTAFCIAVERACKFARRAGAKLRVLPERASKADDNRLERYYDELKSTGMPFDACRSIPYAPLGAAEFGDTLYELRFKRKSSPMAQIADMYLWPMVMCRYMADYRPTLALRAANRLVECHLEVGEIAADGSKYSCFEQVDRDAAAKGP